MLTIVFDLDGTLIDTAPDLIDTLNLILAQEGVPGVPFDDRPPLIGGGARGMIERALAGEGRACSTADVDRLFTAFIAHYAAHIADRSRPFPQLEATLDRLAGAGHRLAVCTNKLEWLSIAAPAHAATGAALCCDLRPGHFRRAEARSGSIAAHHPARRRRAGRGRSWSATPERTSTPRAPRTCRSSPWTSAIAMSPSRHCSPTASSVRSPTSRRRSAALRPRSRSRVHKYRERLGRPAGPRRIVFERQQSPIALDQR